MGKEGESGACGNATKGAAREEAGAPCKRRSAGKKVEEGRTGGGGVRGQATRSAVGVEEKFMGGVEKEGEVVLWINSATRCGIMGVGVVRPRSRCHIFKMPKIWQRRMLHGRQSGTRSSPVLEKRKDKLVWMQRRKGTEQRVSKRLEKRSKGGESGTAQRGKSAAKWRMVRRTRKHNKRGG